MKFFKIHLIWPLPFFDKDINIDSIKFWNLFWNILFDFNFLKSFFSYTNLQLSKNSLNDFKLTLKNIQKSYLIFKKTIKIYTSNEELFFAYKNINKLLDYINSSDFKLSFYLDTYIQEKLSFKNKNIFRFFYEKYLNLDLDQNKNILFFDVKNSHELYQIWIILDILKENKVDFNIIKIYISLINLSEFDNKVMLKDKIKELSFFEYIDDIFISDIDKNYISFLEKYNLNDSLKNSLKIKKIFWKKYISLDFFNKWCSWRKCSFCNIGKFHKLTTYTYLEKIKITEKNLEIIKKNNIDCLDIFDPSISLDDILIICNEIIKSWLDIKIHTRMRIDENYSQENCNILKKAWVSYLWLWLEHTSIRINKLFNKYDNYDNFLLNIKSNINNCLKSWIWVHLYTILWFPWETIEELYELRDFLLSFDNKLLTYTPWRFWLNRGTYIYNNPKLFWIKNVSNNIYSQWIDYSSDNNINDDMVTNIQNTLNNSFLFNNSENLNDANWFFCFLESSSIFHINKMYSREFPNN